MAFYANYKSSLTHHDLERYLKKIEVCGVDPYDLIESECEFDVEVWPKITEVDRIDYFVYQTNFVSKNSMKCLKSLEAHNFFTSGFVYRPCVKEVSQESVLVLGKVKHSQSLSLPPLKCWLMAKKTGEITTGHCSCMAGRGETCSHLAAIVFMLEYAAKVKADVVGTDQLNAWLPPTMGNQVPKRTIADMDFSSSASRLAKIQRIDFNEPAQENTTSQWITDKKEKIPEAFSDFFSTLAQLDPKFIVLSTLPGDKSDPFIPPEVSDELPKLMSTLYEESAEELSYEDLLIRCKVVMQDVCCADEEGVKKVEEKTRGQASSDLWFKFRQGRITASNMKLVCRGNIQEPAKSTINTICYGSQKFYSKDVERGKKLEKAACNKYAYIQKQSHTEFSVNPCGLFICKDKAYLAASPDGIVSCGCCEGSGGLEIKCPREENMNACFDESGSLLKNHAYFYQVQTQMYVCELSYCDFFVYNKKNHILHRVLPDKDCHEEIVVKSQLYFMHVILPELIAKHFSLNRVPLAPSILNSINETVNICYCQTPRRDPMITCAGKNCTFKEFHCRCVDLGGTRKSKWFCEQCKKK